MDDLCRSDCWLKPHVAFASLPPSSHFSYDKSLEDLHAVAKQLYTPLEVWQTRLVELEPGTFNQPIRCKLLAADIIHFDGLGVKHYSKAIEYEALSYCWGNPSLTHPLLVNELEYAVTSNLASALRHLRRPRARRYLWVDALCIDQWSDTEKTLQVRNMLAIYQKAKKVIAWLGEDEQSTHLAFNLLEKINDLLEVAHSSLCLNYVDQAYESLMMITRRPWFKRTWIRQEVSAATNLVLQCGTFQVKFAKFMDVIRRRSDIDTFFGKRYGQSTKAFTKDAIRHLIVLAKGAATGFTEADVLYATLEDGIIFQASDPRDKVYGILGMVQSKIVGGEIINRGKINSMRRFPVDYTKSVSTVFKDVVTFTASLEPILKTICRYELQDERRPKMPTWAIDWAKPVVKSPFLAEEYAVSKAISFVGRGLLKLEGYRIGVVHGSKNDDSPWPARGHDFMETGNFARRFDETASITTLLENGRYSIVGVDVHADVVPLTDVTIFNLSCNCPNYRRCAESQAVVPSFCCNGDILVYVPENSLPVLLHPVEGGCYNFCRLAWPMQMHWRAILRVLGSSTQRSRFHMEEFYLM